MFQKIEKSIENIAKSQETIRIGQQDLKQNHIQILETEKKNQKAADQTQQWRDLVNWKIEIKTKIYKPLPRKIKGNYEVKDETNEGDSEKVRLNQLVRKL